MNAKSFGNSEFIKQMIFVRCGSNENIPFEFEKLFAFSFGKRDTLVASALLEQSVLLR